MEKSTFHIYLFILFTWFLSSNAIGQEVPLLQSFDKNAYAGGNQNWAITQNDEGYIFVANHFGVRMYNGFKWSRIDLPFNQIPRCIFKGSDNKIYIGGYEFFGFLDIASPVDIKYQAVADSLLDGTSQEIWNIVEQDSSLYFQSFSYFFCYDYEVVNPIEIRTNILFAKNIHDRLFVPEIKGDILSLEGQKLLSIAPFLEVSMDSKVVGMLELPAKGFLVVTEKGTFYQYLDGALKLIRKKAFETIQNYGVNKVVTLKNGGFAVGTISGGLFILNADYSIRYHLSKRNGLLNNTVLSLFEDKDENLWVGLDKGINLIRLNRQIENYTDNEGVLGEIFQATQYDSKGYFASNLGLIEKDKGRLKTIAGSKGLNWSILPYKQDLFVANNRNVYRWSSGELKSLNAPIGGWHLDTLGERKLLFASYLGLYQIDLDAEARFTPIGNGDLLIENFHRNGNEIIGFSSKEGFYRITLNPAQNEVLVIEKIESPSSWKANKVQFFESNDSLLVFNGHSFSVVSDRIYPISNAAVKKLADSQSSLYKLVMYIENVAEVEGTLPTFYLYGTKSGDYFSKDDGFVKVSDFTFDKPSLTVNVDYVSIHKTQKTLRDSILDFPSNENDLSVNLRKLDGDFGMNNLEYKLEFWEDEWMPVPENGQIVFNNLNDGTYFLYITDGYETKQLLEVTIRPHWYESKVAFLIYLLIALFVLYLINKNNKRKFELREQKLRREKTLELEAARIKSEKEKLESELLHKSKLLANRTLTLAKKNSMLEELKQKISQIKIEATQNNKGIKQKITHLIDQNLSSDEDWAIFEKNFNEVHAEFLSRLVALHPTLNSNDKKLAAFIKMNLSSKEIAPLLNISYRSVENYRSKLRKKLKLKREDNLSRYIDKI